ncbi:MAG: ABC transporter ATP-binding protein [Rickettsiales bacterium]|nr:ABC transporter ATP-binding protein [Rickettsiales bacterium]
MTLTLQSISHRYITANRAVREVLQGISFQVHEHEFMCLAGESGCGKSTLLRLIAGLERPYSGSILRDGAPLSSASHFVPPEKRRMGLVFQQATLFPHLTVLENVCFGMKPVSHPLAHELLQQVRFSGRDHEYPHMLSGGQQQRVALARALAAQPELLMMDEPFASLDYDLRQHIRADIHRLLKARGITTLMVTHDPQEAMQMADRIILLSPQGHIVQIGTPMELYLRPHTAYAARFFGHANIIMHQDKSWVIRPEHLILGETGSTQGMVQSVRFSGSHQLVEILWQDQILLAKDYKLLPLVEQQVIHFTLDMTKAHALDASEALSVAA